jgi:hypothetical protein
LISKENSKKASKKNGWAKKMLPAIRGKKLNLRVNLVVKMRIKNQALLIACRPNHKRLYFCASLDRLQRKIQVAEVRSVIWYD